MSATLMDRQKAKEVLLDLSDICHWCDLPFFLIQGTALGAYRDNDFVPTEKDIDLGFLYEDFVIRLLELVYELMSEGYELHTINLPFTTCRTIVAKKNGIKADLVSYARWNDKRFASRPVDERGLEPYSIVHDASLLEKTEETSLFRNTFRIPSPIETYLELEYGSDWHTPTEDHVSRTRVYGFVNQEGIPNDYLESQLR